MAPPDLYDQDSADPRERSAGVQLPESGTGRRRTGDGAPQIGLRSGRAAAPARGPRRASLAARAARVTATAWRGPLGWIVPLAVLFGSILGLYWVATDRFGDDPPAGEPLEEVVPAVPAGPSALVVQVDDGGTALSFTLFVLDGDSGGTVILLPASTMVEIPGFGLDRLARAAELGGVPLAELSLRNLLSMEFTHTAVLGADDWADLTRVLGAVTVDNPAKLDQVGDDDRVEVLWPAGTVEVEADEVADFLAGRAVEETDLERLVRHQRFWTAFLTARQGIVGMVDDPERDLDAFLDEAALRAAELDYRILPVETVGGPAELYGVDDLALANLLRTIAPTEGAEGAGRVRVQILNGVGLPGLAEPVTELLIPTGTVVQLTGNALEFDHDVTQVVYYHDEYLDAAHRIRDELGVGEVVKQREPIDVVDLTVVVGADLASLVAGEDDG